MDEVLVTNRVEWCVLDDGYYRNREIWRTDVRRQKLRHSESVSDV